MSILDFSVIVLLVTSLVVVTSPISQHEVGRDVIFTCPTGDEEGYEEGDSRHQVEGKYWPPPPITATCYIYLKPKHITRHLGRCNNALNVQK